MSACSTAPENGDLGVTGAQVIAPQQPALSVLALRMHALDADRMPPLVSVVRDDNGIALIEAWIASPDVCIEYPDGDADGVGDNIDNCALVMNADQQDLDQDGVGDRCDNCLHTANAGQRDADGDGIGNACDLSPRNVAPRREDPGAVRRAPPLN